VFNQIIDRFGELCGLTPNEALKSDLIKKISLDLIEGKVVIIDFKDCKFKTKKPKIVSINK